MSKEAYILEQLAENHIDTVGTLVKDSSEDHKFYVFVDIKRRTDGGQHPSNHKLKLLSDNLKKENIHIVFILVENGNEDIQASVRSALFHSFPDIVRNSFLEPEPRGFTVWIEPKKILTSEKGNEIESKLQELFSILETPLKGVKITSSENIPTPTACLAILRQKAPVALDPLKEELLKSKFHVPNSEWLSKMLDKLRKVGKVLRHKNGNYTLTLLGLKSLGSAKSRNSPDVRRALDFARRAE